MCRKPTWAEPSRAVRSGPRRQGHSQMSRDERELQHVHPRRLHPLRHCFAGARRRPDDDQARRQGDRLLDDRDGASRWGQEPSDGAAVKGHPHSCAQTAHRVRLRPHPSDGEERALRAPLGDRWIIGTTDTEWTLHLDHPAANSADIEYLLGLVNEVLARPLTHADIVGAYAGLRPLASAGGIDTTRVSREHEVRRSARGFVSVVSGKYTTYRLMARDAVDAAARELEFRESSESKPAGPPA